MKLRGAIAHLDGAATTLPLAGAFPRGTSDKQQLSAPGARSPEPGVRYLYDSLWAAIVRAGRRAGRRDFEKMSETEQTGT